MPRRTRLLRMAPGYERYKRISLLYETSLTDTFRQVGPEDGGDEGRKKFIVHLARKCRQSAIPEEDAVRFALIHPFGREQEMELRATFGNVYRKEKHCSVTALYAPADAGGDADGRVYDKAL